MENIEPVKRSRGRPPKKENEKTWTKEASNEYHKNYYHLKLKDKIKANPKPKQKITPLDRLIKKLGKDYILEKLNNI